MVLERILKGSSTGYGDVCSSANKRDINVIRLNKCQHLEDINVIQTGNGPTRLSKCNIYISVLSGRKQHVRLKAESQKTPRLASKLAISARLSLKQPALDVSLMASGLDPLNIQWLPIQCPRCPRCPSCWLLGNTAASSHGWVPAIGCKSIMVRSLCNGCREHPAAE
jgi:hypothetical protein